jgi:hypothetical protein
MKVAKIRITEAILFKLGLLSLVNFNAREYNFSLQIRRSQLLARDEKPCPTESNAPARRTWKTKIPVKRRQGRCFLRSKFYDIAEHCFIS